MRDNSVTRKKVISACARLPTAILLLVLLAVPALSSAQEASGFLLRQRYRIVSEANGLDTTTETIIFRDGLIVTVTLSANPVNQTIMRRRRASREALSRLHAAFRRHGIGNQVGECIVGTTPFDFFSETITYFTKGPHGHTFRTGEPFTRPCDVHVNLIVSEISDIVFDSPAEPGLQEVLVPN